MHLKSPRQRRETQLPECFLNDHVVCKPSKDCLYRAAEPEPEEGEQEKEEENAKEKTEPQPRGEKSSQPLYAPKL